MATKNIVPRTGSEGEVGTSAKPWDKAHIDEVSASIGLSGAFLYGDGTGITNLPVDTLDQVTTAGNNNFKQHCSRTSLSILPLSLL